MGLAGDIREGKELWSKSSLPMRLAIAIGTFLAVSSVASLADTVFAWKGFIRDGVDLYRSCVSFPLKDAAARLGYNYTHTEADALVALALFVNSLLRLVSHKTNKQTYASTDSRLERIGALLGTAIMHSLAFLCLFLPLAITFGVLVDSDAAGYIVLGLVVIGFIFVYWVAHDPPTRTRMSDEFMLVFFGPVVLAVAIVLILGAINAGLSRPLP